MATVDTAEKAIELSTLQGSDTRMWYDPSEVEKLRTASEDYVESSEFSDYWGTTEDDEEWRVMVWHDFDADDAGELDEEA